MTEVALLHDNPPVADSFEIRKSNLIKVVSLKLEKKIKEKKKKKENGQRIQLWSTLSTYINKCLFTIRQ